ncbi:Aspercryptin biosynthesis cluster-specific transcription regulator atnN [Apiospora saccharicola]
MTAPLVPRKRASKPKVRTGCDTCKKVGPYRDVFVRAKQEGLRGNRRVKCDERKPKCVRCEKLNHSCAYATGSEAKSPKEESSSSPDSSCRSSPAREVGTLFYQPRCYNLNSQEGLYFELYQHRVAKRLAYPELWYRSVLRESVRDRTIRHGVIAIGALAQAGLEHAARTSARQKVPRRTLSRELMRSAHYREAIQNYTQALSTFRNRIELEGGSTPPRTVIIATLLFLIFEQMQGNSVAVQQLTGNVIAMLRGSLITFQAKGTSESQIAAEIDDEGVQEAEMVLPRMFAASLSGCEVHPTVYQLALQIQVDPLDVEVPVEGASRLQIKRVWDRMITRLTLYTIRGRAALADPASDLDEYREGQRIFLDRLAQSKEVMTAMQEKRQDLDVQFRLTIKVILCAIHIAEVYVSCFLDETDQSWDCFTGHYEKIIEIAESIFDVLPPSFDGWPMYDCSLPPIIHCVLQKCRDPVLHRRAAAVYQKLSQNERSLGLGLVTRDASDDVVVGVVANDWASEVTTEDGESAVSSPGSETSLILEAMKASRSDSGGLRGRRRCRRRRRHRHHRR